MTTKNFIYRQKQRIKYHTAKTDFDKLIAEINKNSLVVDVIGEKFSIKGINAQFDKDKHAFIIKKFYVLQQMLRYGRGEFLVEGGEVFFLIDTLKLRVETAEEIFIINEVFFENCYNFIVPDQEVVVVDIGMNVGFASLFLANKPHVRKVYAFEPFMQTYEAALTNFSYNAEQAKKIVAYNYGLGNTNEKVNALYSVSDKGRNKSTASDQQINGAAYSGKVAIEIRDASEVIASILEENRNVSIHVKMDCEGAEFIIFDALAKDLLPEQIKGMMIEWHFKEPEGIVQFLQNNGFKMIKTDLGVKSGLIYAFR